MIHLTIDNRDVTIDEGGTLLDAANKLAIDIPTMCHLSGHGPNTSCMVCMVQDIATDRLVPSCTQPAAEGMRIETNNARVREARQDTLELLLSEHVGDCDAVCQRACPSMMNIPLMIRQIKDENFAQAIITVKRDIVIPAVLGRICPAPCENGCNRKFYDTAMSICTLKRFVADIDLAQATPFRPATAPATGKRVAIVGAGPAGLAAAYQLAQFGHAAHVYDRRSKPGGLLQFEVPEEKFPKSVLDAEIEQVRVLGVEFKLGQTLGKEFDVRELQEEYDAVILATGATDNNVFPGTPIETNPRGIVVDRKTFETALPGVFAGGNAINEGKIAIRSVGHGKGMAYSADQYINGKPVIGYPKKFQSIMGKLYPGETDQFIKDAAEFDRLQPARGIVKGYDPLEAVKESSRCFHCDCRKQRTCKLRKYSEEYGANHRRFKYSPRKPFQKVVQHDLVNYEPGKCIKCNICIQITERSKEQLGFTFINRGFDVQMSTPFTESFGNGLQQVAKECVESCPTAALAWRDGEAGFEPDA
jgi:hypothetical protein